MRVSVFSRISALVLTALSVLFLGVLLWANTQINYFDNQSRSYQHIEQSIQSDVVAPLNSYLLSGNAVLLGEAREAITGVLTNEVVQGNSLFTQLSGQLEQIQQQIDTDYRAIGKLSGAANGLIINAENGLSNEIASLVDYANEGRTDSPQVAGDYLTGASELIQLLSQLIHQREAMLSNGSEATLTNTLGDMQQTIEKLAELPLLGVMETLPDQSMVLVPREAKDLGAGIIGELQSLVRRYPGELTRTIEQNRQRQQAFTQLSAQLESLKQTVVGAKQSLTEQQQQRQAEIKVLVLVFVVLLLAVAAFNFVLLRKMVLQPLRMLRDAMRKLADQSDLDYLPGADKDTEMGEIAAGFNALLERTSSEAGQKKQQMDVVKDALELISREVTEIISRSRESTDNATRKQQILVDLSDLTERLAASFGELQTNADDTFQSMQECQQDNKRLLNATENASQTIGNGQSALGELNRSVNEVENILQVIAGIADQTNLLALNAAIEAARAGEHGRGFAVVADEVRKLSQQTQTSLTDIRTILTGLESAASNISGHYTNINDANEEQQNLVAKLTKVLLDIEGKAQSSSGLANQSAELMVQQSETIAAFHQHMTELLGEFDKSSQLLNHVSDQVNQQQYKIEKVFV
ncbi:Methyl-accepting chemotaxis protein [Pseudidiomarina planktonica]|uniref:Methyl-accepting chemotaxis protein n=1 Tax=Pseudidiomarina planktonica TaxID=1323738 RepID=A0A1Y6ECP7_9GAMM|nr:methyl-accepting chemotaxis protein [Pseudidiomarina planktonica]RUO66303.1 methyl-accepting chemotaxis protein [Pseudidiomarina planktonica]SMQ58991.1 Methyl-accepting chemotaxis protein [Pseudidiomarina planktonica]